MKIKKYLLLFVIFYVHSLSFAQNSKVILNVGDDKITLDEFKSIFYKNNHNDSTITKEYLDEYMQLFINFRLKVKEAKSLQYDTIPEFLSELAMYRDQLSKPYLSDNHFDEKLIKEAYHRMQTDVNASHILISVSEKALPIDTLEAFKKTEEIRSKILKGMGFFSKSLTICHPKSVLKGMEISPELLRENAISSNSFTIFPTPKKGRFPPFTAVALSSENCFASSPKSSPLFSFSEISSILVLLISICSLEASLANLNMICATFTSPIAFLFLFTFIK